MRWDVFCRVVDNFGDIGVCWRLARQLARREQTVRLWVDDPQALAWMAPHGEPGVTVHRWSEPWLDVVPHEVVVEAFGCDPPAPFVAAMRRPQPPVWINLEYLSAEGYVERSHGLASPQLAGPGVGLQKWFFFPGFTAATGGLLREPDLAAQRDRFDAEAWCRTHGLESAPGERRVSLFCYPDAPVAALVKALADHPTLLALTAGAPEVPPAPGLRVVRLPWLTQDDFDRLLWSCDLNLVRGEDSLVRALWAGRPLLWQIYPQHDGAHAAKLAAFLQVSGASTVPGLEALMGAWNSLAAWPEDPPLSGARWAAWQGRAAEFRQRQTAIADLTTRLLEFVGERLGRAGPSA